MFLNKIDVPYCLVVFFVVCPRLRPFWSVFGELALFWCSTAKRKEKDKAEQWFPECPSLEANNSAGKLPPASIPPEIQSRDVAVPCPFTRFAIPPTDRSLAMLSSLARSASKFRTRPQVAQARNMSIGEQRHCCVTFKSIRICMGKKRIMFTVGSVDRSIGRYSGRHSADSRSTVGR